MRLRATEQSSFFRKTIVDRDSGNLCPIYIHCIKKIVVLASEPVGGRSRATELPCCIPHVAYSGDTLGGGGGCVLAALAYCMPHMAYSGDTPGGGGGCSLV